MFDPQLINEAAFTYYSGLERVKEHVDLHYAEPIPVQALARVAGYERKYFSTFFHAKVGIRFRDWMTYVRVSHAMELIRNRDHSITAVALAVGFQDLRTFERAFKRTTDMTPSAFRDSVRPC